MTVPRYHVLRRAILCTWETTRTNMPAERTQCDSANLQDGGDACAWCMRCDTVKWQGGEILISGIRWVFMLSFLCQVWDRLQMVALATWPPPSLSRSPDCEMQSAVSSPFAMSRRFLRRCLSVETNNLKTTLAGSTR